MTLKRKFNRNKNRLKVERKPLSTFEFTSEGKLQTGRLINVEKMCCIILMIGSILGMTMMPYSVCKASSASITLGTDTTSVTKGDKVIVSIQLSSEALLGDFEAYISYNDDVLEFQSGESFLAGGDGLLKLSDTNVSNMEYSRKYIIKFIAKDIGNSDITINEKAAIYDFETGLDMSVSSNRLNISVVAAETASTNANLSSLELSPSSVIPNFDSDITEYATNVTYEVEQLIISALPEDDAATVTIQGNDKLLIGTNKVTVTVKAESGDTKKYTIEVDRDDKPQDADTEGPEETDKDQELNTSEQNNSTNNDTQIDNIQVLKDGDETYIQNGYRYRISEVKDEADIPEGYINTTIMINEITVNAYTSKNDLESDFLLLYLVNEDGKEGFYQYDRIEKTIQRYTINSDGTSSNKYVMTDEIIHSEEYKSRITTMGIIIAILGAISISMSIALIHFYMKPRD